MNGITLTTESGMLQFQKRIDEKIQNLSIANAKPDHTDGIDKEPYIVRLRELSDMLDFSRMYSKQKIHVNVDEDTFRLITLGEYYDIPSIL